VGQHVWKRTWLPFRVPAVVIAFMRGVVLLWSLAY
jgi:hypothetical protein